MGYGQAYSQQEKFEIMFRWVRRKTKSLPKGMVSGFEGRTSRKKNGGGENIRQ